MTLKMVLTPESLGEIEVDLRFTKDSNLQVTLRPETLEVAKLIQTNAGSLREQLSQEHKGLLSLNLSDYLSDDEKIGMGIVAADQVARRKMTLLVWKNKT